MDTTPEDFRGGKEWERCSRRKEWDIVSVWVFLATHSWKREHQVDFPAMLTWLALDAAFPTGTFFALGTRRGSVQGPEAIFRVTSDARENSECGKPGLGCSLWEVETQQVPSRNYSAGVPLRWLKLSLCSDSQHPEWLFSLGLRTVSMEKRARNRNLPTVLERFLQKQLLYRHCPGSIGAFKGISSLWDWEEYGCGVSHNWDWVRSLRVTYCPWADNNSSSHSLSSHMSNGDNNNYLVGVRIFYVTDQTHFMLKTPLTYLLLLDMEQICKSGVHCYYNKSLSNYSSSIQ